jgi:adenine phosphoribosyltransferase
MRGVNPEPLRAAIRAIPDFPKPGIVFRDITPVLSDPRHFCQVIDLLAESATEFRPTKIVGIDARGFLFGAAVAYKLGLGFVPVRKRGKLPYRTVDFSYTLEYGQADVEMHIDAVQPDETVVLVDDLLATGGTAGAAIQLIRKLGANVVAALFFIELLDLEGRSRLFGVPVQSLVQF